MRADEGWGDQEQGHGTGALEGVSGSRGQKGGTGDAVKSCCEDR